MSKHRFTCVEKRNWEKLTLKKCFYINFGLWAEKFWTFSKTVKYDFQNRSLRMQMNFFRNFSRGKNVCMKNFGLRTETSASCEKLFLRVVEAAFHVSRATLWEKDDKSKISLKNCLFVNFGLWAENGSTWLDQCVRRWLKVIRFRNICNHITTEIKLAKTINNGDSRLLGCILHSDGWNWDQTSHPVWVNPLIERYQAMMTTEIKLVRLG